MSTIDNTAPQAVIDEEFEVITAQPTGLSQEAVEQAKADILDDLVDSSVTLDSHKAASFSAVTGYEATFRDFLGQIADAVRMGVQHKEIADKFKAENAAAAKRGEGKPHTWTAVGPISNLEATGWLLAKGDILPDGFVWRPAKDGTISLRDGEKSITDLVTSVVRPSDSTRDALKAWAKEQGLKTDALYGKRLVGSIIADGADLDEVVATLEKTAKHQASIARKHAAAEKAAANAGTGSTSTEEDEEEAATPVEQTAEDILANALALLRIAQGHTVADRDKADALLTAIIDIAQSI